MIFSDATTSRTYSDRSVAPSWLEWCKQELQPEGKVVIDIGCGGGIYTRGFLACGAAQVWGVDSSEQYIREARAACPAARFRVASCEETGLESGSADLVFERALIHHLTPDQLAANAREMSRILRSGGRAIVQDRTIEDALAADDDRFWIRRQLMQNFPRLRDFEQARRPGTSQYCAILKSAGFTSVGVDQYSEIRRTYSSKAELAEELRARKGKSILYELSDSELAEYIEAVLALSPEKDIIERDRWTIWTATKA